MRTLLSLVSAVAISAALAGCASRTNSAGPVEPAGQPTVSSAARSVPAARQRSMTNEELAREPAGLTFIWLEPGMVTTWLRVCPKDTPERRCYLIRTEEAAEYYK